MKKKEDGDTRFYMDLDLQNKKILSWDYGNRFKLVQVLANPAHHRVFLTKGQYNKLENRYLDLKSGAAKKA